MKKELRAVVLLSGGIDSATVLLLARKQGYEPYAISFRYGQRHLVELESAEKLAGRYAKKHLVVDVGMRKIAGSALTGSCDVPKNQENIGSDIPVTYVPARNTIFLSLALGWGEVLGANDIFIGANAVDYSGYPDCRPEYIEAFERMANLATCAGVSGSNIKIHAPLIKLSKAEIIKTAHDIGLDLSLTHSCYDPDKKGRACGACDSCIIRKRGFAEANISDPTVYNFH